VTPPAAFTVAEDDKDVVVIPRTEPVTVKGVVTGCASLTWAVKVKLPGCVTVPVRAPAALRVTPDGTVAVLVHVYGGLPPVTANVVESELPTATVPRLPELVIVSAANEIFPV
jgi:hypothetical protein